MSTAHSVCDFTGSPAALDLGYSEARLFYLSNVAITSLACVVRLMV